MVVGNGVCNVTFFFLNKKREQSICSIRSFIQAKKNDPLFIDVNEKDWMVVAVDLDACLRSEFVHYEMLRRIIDDPDGLDYHNSKIFQA